MKTRTKALLLTCCAVLLVAASVLGTVAYLADTKTVTNTFTVGKVYIDLDEAKIGDDGKALEGAEAGRVTENKYNLLPGHTYDKDPTLTVKAGSEESYVRLLVTATFQKVLTDDLQTMGLDEIFTGYNADWVRNGAPAVTTVGEGSAAHTVITYEYRYRETVAGKNADNENADNKLPALFTGISVPTGWDNAMMEKIGGFEIKVVGQAIQKDGFTDADAAWAAFATQSGT